MLAGGHAFFSFTASVNVQQFNVRSGNGDFSVFIIGFFGFGCGFLPGTSDKTYGLLGSSVGLVCIDGGQYCFGDLYFIGIVLDFRRRLSFFTNGYGGTVRRCLF